MKLEHRLSSFGLFMNRQVPWLRVFVEGVVIVGKGVCREGGDGVLR